MRIWLAAGALFAVVACSEKLTTPGDCPGNCPADHLIVRDTVIAAELDSTYTGFVSAPEGIRLLLSDGFNGGTSIGVARFAQVADSILYLDTLRAATLDSAALTLQVTARDPAAAGLAIEIYRLPSTLTLDSTAGYADAAPFLTSDRLIGTFAVPDSLRNGTVRVLFTGADLAKLAFAPGDSNTLKVAYRLVAPVPTGVSVGASASGITAPGFFNYLRLALPDTTIFNSLPRIVLFNSTLSDAPAGPPPPDLLTAGGAPSSRAIIRFTLPPQIRDTAQIIRATLMLVPAEPLLALPGDSAQLDVEGVFTDLGPKSPRIESSPALIATRVIEAGTTDTVGFDVTAVARLWGGTSAAPSVLTLALSPEASTFGFARFGSSRSAGAKPALRITYALPYPFEVQ